MVFLPLKITSLTKIYLLSLQETSQANIEKPALCTVEEKYPLGLEFNNMRGAGLDCGPSLAVTVTIILTTSRDWDIQIWDTSVFQGSQRK